MAIRTRKNLLSRLSQISADAVEAMRDAAVVGEDTSLRLMTEGPLTRVIHNAALVLAIYGREWPNHSDGRARALTALAQVREEIETLEQWLVDDDD